MAPGLKLRALVVALCALLPSLAHAEADGPAAPSHGGQASNDWVRRPPGGTAPYFSDKALQTGVGGLAKINCAVDTEGHLQDCHVVSETPPGYGYGDSALKMAHLFKVKPRTDSARTGDDRVTLPIRFQNPDPASVGQIGK
jgi:TonB family protein